MSENVNKTIERNWLCILDLITFIYSVRVLYVLFKFKFLINIKDPSAVFVKYILY